MSAEEVAKFYNNLHNQDVEDRQSSRIIYLRGFNNWIKSMLIQDAKAQINQAFPGNRFVTVLDLACGKGGDMWKWQKADIEEIIFADVASKSIEQCRQRYMEGRTRTGNHAAFGASFIVIDATGERLADKLPRPMFFEIVSCQFALHYAFRSEKHLRMMLYNISLNLKPKGVFVGTMTDGERIVQYLRRTNNGIFENDVVRVEYMDKSVPNWSNLTPPLFGAKIRFALDTQVNCPEYLGYFPLLVEIAKEFNLELVFYRSFPEAIDYYYAKIDNRNLMGRMRALEEYPIDDERYNAAKENFSGYRKLKEEYDHAEKKRKEIQNSGERRSPYCIGTLSKSEWEAINMYCMFMFRKK